MKIWSSKYALTAGVMEHECEELDNSMVRIEYGVYLHGEGKEWHRTREAAVRAAEAMRKARIASLRKQIARLEKLQFDT